MNDLNKLDALKYAMATDAQVERYQTLSLRQVEVGEYVAQGKRTKEIARLLNISPRTVEVHRKALMDKLELSTTLQLAIVFFQIEVRARANGGVL